MMVFDRWRSNTMCTFVKKRCNQSFLRVKHIRSGFFEKHFNATNYVVFNLRASQTMKFTTSIGVDFDDRKIFGNLTFVLSQCLSNLVKHFQKLLRHVEFVDVLSHCLARNANNSKKNHRSFQLYRWNAWGEGKSFPSRKKLNNSIKTLIKESDFL